MNYLPAVNSKTKVDLHCPNVSSNYFRFYKETVGQKRFRGLLILAVPWSSSFRSFSQLLNNPGIISADGLGNGLELIPFRVIAKKDVFSVFRIPPSTSMKLHRLYKAGRRVGCWTLLGYLPKEGSFLLHFWTVVCLNQLYQLLLVVVPLTHL